MTRKFIPSTETSCLCDCGCFLISLEQDCPICGASNPVYGNKSITEREAEYQDKQDQYSTAQTITPNPFWPVRVDAGDYRASTGHYY